MLFTHLLMVALWVRDLTRNGARPLLSDFEGIAP